MSTVVVVCFIFIFICLIWSWRSNQNSQITETNINPNHACPSIHTKSAFYFEAANPPNAVRCSWFTEWTFMIYWPSMEVQPGALTNWLHYCQYNATVAVAVASYTAFSTLKYHEAQLTWSNKLKHLLTQPTNDPKDIYIKSSFCLKASTSTLSLEGPWKVTGVILQGGLGY